jgi:hypothetical protein
LRTFWIDDSGLIRRMQLTTKGKLTSQCDLRYEPQYGVEAFPVSWVDVRYSPTGSVMIENQVEVLDAAVNADVPSTEFDVRFPPGTTVHDNKHGGKEYLVQDDGTMREKNVANGEVRSQDPPGFLARYWRLIGTALAIVIVLLLGGYQLRVHWGKK